MSRTALPIHNSSTSRLREQSFYSSFFKYSSTAGPQEQQIQHLGSDRFCLIVKNQTIADDTNWKKEVTMSLVPYALWFASNSNRASHCHMFPHRMITVINDVIA